MTILLGNFGRTQLDATWTTGNYEPLLGDWASLDQKIAQSVNGVNGGTWSMAAGQTTTIAGSGLIALSPTVVQGGGILETAGGTAKILLNDANDYPELAVGHPGRTQVIGIDPLAGATWAPFYAWSRYESGGVSGLQSLAICLKNPDGSLTTPEFQQRLRVHNGGTLVSVSVNFRVPFSRSQAPVTMPKVRVIRRDAAGNVTLLRGQTTDALGLTADAQGFVSMPKVNSAAAWFANGAVQTLTFICDQNNTALDTSLYSYSVHVVEEGLGASGSSAAWPLAATVKAPVACCDVTSNAINGIAVPGPVDGVAVAFGTRLLATNTRASNAYRATSGVWVSQGGSAWIRDADLDESSEFVQGVVVPVTAGVLYGQTAWIVTTPGPISILAGASAYTNISVSWAMIGDFTAQYANNLFTFTHSPPPPVLGGNVYTGVQATCTITNTAPE